MVVRTPEPSTQKNIHSMFAGIYWRETPGKNVNAVLLSNNGNPFEPIGRHRV